MYLYIYDEQTKKKKFTKTLTNIEQKLTDLGLKGKPLRLKEVKNPINSIQKELNKGYKTVVVVGGDQAIHKTVNALATSYVNNSKLKPALGVIPLKETNNTIASALGIHDPLEACDILLARRNIKINLGKINDSYFFSGATINNPEKQLEINQNYSINVSKTGQIFAVNFSNYVQSNPFDNLLDLYIFTKKKKFFSLTSSQKIDTSYFPLKNLDIHHKKASVLVDNSCYIIAPINISVAQQKINIIVGKKRTF